MTKGDDSILGLNLSASLASFAIGVLTTALGFGTRYAAQATYSIDREKLGLTFTYTAITLCLVSYSLFGWGVYGAYSAFMCHFSP